MNVGLDSEMQAALSALEASFHVRLIATFPPDLVWAPANVEAAGWLAGNFQEFDQFPVKDGDETVGILLRQDAPQAGTVRDAMRPLREGLIVSADMSIIELIPHLRDSHYRLVIRGRQIDGLVTQSDVLKLPVRMLLFGLISHLELCLRQLIRSRRPWPEWGKPLAEKRRKDIEGSLRELSHARFEPDPLEFTNLNDVVGILAHEADLGEAFRDEMSGIRSLRNDVAHAKTYIASMADVRQFVDRFVAIRSWINRTSEILRPS